MKYLWLALGLAACGDYTDSGDGSGTLRVEAQVVYLAGGANRIFADVRVEKSGDPVSGATVRLTDGDSDEVLELSEQTQGNGNLGRYDGELEGYHRRLALEVEDGDDFLDAKLEGPGAHTIFNPENDATVALDDIGDHLHVSWSVEDGIAADSVHVFLDGAEEHNADDTGHYKELPKNEVEEGAQQIIVLRRNRVSLDGGTSGSSFESGYRAANDFVVK